VRAGLAADAVIYLRHRTASDQSSGVWEYDPERLTVIAHVSPRHDSAPIDIAIAVCSQKKLRRGAYPISEVAEGTWHVSPVLVVDENGHHMGKCVPYDFHGALHDFLELSGTPEDVAEEMRRLDV